MMQVSVLLHNNFYCIYPVIWKAFVISSKFMLFSNFINSCFFDLTGCNIRRHRERNRWSPSQNRRRCTDWSWFNYTRKYQNWWRCDDCCWLPCVKGCPFSQVLMLIYLRIY
jgi:hypothetical protein